MTNTNELTSKLKAAAEKATPGPWRRTSTIFNGITYGPFSLTNEKVLANVAEKANAEFIAAANPAAVLELIATLEAARADCRENAARIAELESQRKLAFSACNRWADKCREAEKRVAELERQAIQPLPIGELINRLEEQTGEPWGEVYLAGINLRRGESNHG
ncbi:ead/Ea22-like family protein [Cronobacter malonaticus]|uniref:ead/Ea22-like family protein n=1 Tax=Cronobacter malonaticus TaxID=413503 RepID=UPI000CFD7734|nr:ead/Ea22-like family protein [Cronobacter malonaticus]